MNFSECNSEHSQVNVSFRETLELLDWPLVCQHISTFASTFQGKKLCKHFPLPHEVSITRLRLAETLELGELDLDIEGGINFSGVYDIENIVLRCNKGSIASGDELLQIANTLRAARRLRRLIDDPELRPVTTTLLNELSTFPKLEQLLKYGLEESGRIADRASEKLSTFRNQFQKLRLERFDMIKELTRKNIGILQDTSIGDREGRPVLSLKIGALDQLKGKLHGSSASGNTVFIEPEQIIPIGDNIDALTIKILAEEQRLLASWSYAVGENVSSLKHLCEVILMLDFALARARYSNFIQGVPLIFDQNNNNSFILKNFRHPVLIWLSAHNQGQDVSPISIELSDEVRVVAITGPNTGGKTVTLKSIGLASLMARAGLLLPCSDQPSLPWFNHVFADIGDEQSVEQNLSTFSGHIMRISRLLGELKENSGPALVLLDEIGAGTDPSEGTALAIALLKILADRARLTIATTHFGELKSLKYDDPRFENASVAFDHETLTPTYELQLGIPGRSNALLIAERLGLDYEIIELAKHILTPSGVGDINNIIQGLESQRKRQQAAAEDAAALLARAELLHEELLSSWKSQKQYSEKLHLLGRQKLEASIREGQEEVRQLIRRLRDQNADGEIARSAGKRLREMGVDNQNLHTTKNNQGWIPQVGERIRILSLGKAAEVLAISQDGSQLQVICGMFRSTVQLSEVESLDGLKPSLKEPIVKIKSSRPYMKSSNNRTSKNTIDIRGLRINEAEVVVEEYLRTNSGPVWVIHGIGTGKLKQGLRKWMEGERYIEKFTDADQIDGGPGCTVVWLN